MSYDDPQKGEGWNFDDLDNEAWEEALQTGENGTVNMENYDHFENPQELVNFIQGRGTYENTRSFTPGEEDLQDKKRELHNDVWKIPGKLEKIQEYLETGATYGEIDLDATAKARWNITETEAKMQDRDTKYTAHFLVYDPDQKQEGSIFYISGSWYDTPPEETNVEDIFNSVFQEEE